MKFIKLLRLALFTFCLIPIAAKAQSLVPVAATSIVDAGGNPLLSGTVCFQPVVSSGSLAVPVSGFGIGGGGISHGRAVCATVTDGGMPTTNIASSAYTSPAGIQYQITVTDNTTQESWVLGIAYISEGAAPWDGTKWNFNNWIPSGITTLPQIGSSVVTGSVTTQGAAVIGGQFSVAGSSTFSGPAAFASGITAPAFHGLADMSVTSQKWSVLPTQCPSGYSSSHFDISGNALDCNANSYQASGTTTGVIAQNPAGSQLINVPSGYSQNIGSASSYSSFDTNGNLTAPSIIANSIQET